MRIFNKADLGLGLVLTGVFVGLMALFIAVYYAEKPAPTEIFYGVVGLLIAGLVNSMSGMYLMTCED